ncbi:gamma-tubulin complex component 6-like [Diadema setosum]|uniref:gamma-tubulin complex component 6-like n=1 Tax=Diadema setosum TaxID=31175 RepID=UPI003B3BAD7F
MACQQDMSPQSLLGQLVQTTLHQALGSSHPVRLGENAEDVVRLQRRLQARVFNSLLGNLPGPLQHHTLAITPQGGRLAPKERLLMISFNLRQQRKFDEAHQLEILLDRLTQIKSKHPGQSDCIDSVLVFLLALAGTKGNSQKTALGHRRLILPTVGLKAQEENIYLPEGNWFHGDGSHIHIYDRSRPYTNYARELFEGEDSSTPGNDSGISVISSDECQLDSKIFETEPGRDLCGNRLFAVKSIMGNSYERRTRESLFGGLVHSQVTRIDARLTLPSLPDSTNPAFLGLRVPQLGDSPPSDDEGYHESHSDSVLSIQSTAHAPEKENLWEAALRYQPSRHRTWENIGSHPCRTERPYLTEAGTAVLDRVYKLRCKEAAILQPSTRRQLTILGDQKRLIQNVWNILIGLPSEQFVWNEESSSFTVNPSICLTGTTPDSFHQLLAEFARAGTDYTRLWHASQQPATDSTYTGGLVLQAFLGAVRRYLQYYHAQVLLAQSHAEQDSREVTVLLMRTMFGGLLGQLRFLAKLCACDRRKGTKPGGLGDPLPIGIKLLTYLYQEALDSTGTDHYRLMLSLLRSSCAPYLMFIQDWVFHGICRDAYEEFMIQANHTYLFYRDKHYWTHGYLLMSGQDESAVPLFLQELSSDIYVCGKSINLLKQCAPEHFICNATVETPCVGLTFSPVDLELVTSRTKTYVKHMEVLAGQLTVSRQEKERMEEAAKAELLTLARRTAAEEQQRHNEMVKERREAIGAKKRKEFLALKEQMQKDLLRRGQQREDEKEADRERMEELTKREHAAQEVEDELERQAKEEVIKFYADLAKQASAREQRALWRIRRRQLDQEREAFLQRDQEALSRELAAPLIQRPNEELKQQQQQQQQTDGLGEVALGTPEDAQQGDDGNTPTSVALESPQTIGASDVEQKDHIASSSAGQDERESTAKSHVDPTVETEETATLLPVETSFDEEDVLDHDDKLELGSDANEDLEPVLALIRGDKDNSGEQIRSQPERKVKSKTKKGGISIEDFLPRQEQGGEGEDFIDFDDEEQVKDTTLDDVLLEIGSSLPSKAAVMGDGKPLPGDSNEGNVLDDILGSETNLDRNGSGDGIAGLPHRSHSHGHPSQMSLDASASAESLCGLPKRQHSHGHVSDTSHGISGDDLAALGKAGDSSAIPVQGLPQRPHVHGHVSDSSLQTHGSFPEGRSEDLGRVEGVPHLERQMGEQMSSTSLARDGQDQGCPQDLDYGSTEGLPHRSHEHGHPSQSSIQDLGHLESRQEDQSKGVSKQPLHRLASVSSLGISEDTSSDAVDSQRIAGIPHRPHIHGHSSDSTIQSIISGGGITAEGTKAPEDSGYDTRATAQASTSEEESVPGLPHRPVLKGPDSALSHGKTLDQDEGKEHSKGVVGIPQRSHVHGHASDSSLGDVIYPSQSGGGDGGLPAIREERRTVVAMVKQGHHSDSTVQKLLYPIQTSKDEKEEVEMEAVELPITVWADQGRETVEFNFNMFEGLPDTDLLGRTGYTPLKSEIGDYGVQSSDSDSIEATDVLPLPIIIKRSITAPLRAQVWLVNQSILDYFLVELRIDKHFVALRRFLFLQDGEFGQALCDQIFDKLAHCVHLQELLSPITLNQILSRAIQLSASSNSELTDNLSFALKWHPMVYKPNAIDTLDCLELRYHVEWPNNIVITDTCLSKYNKVFSFLLQLKRTGWVLRDIHHQLKISAMIHKAGSSPQYHQLQLFRHEMQHFVNVMQGYVVNQVIHVSWEEFQKDLKDNVHNLDDLREKHALYLNKAILRCLLNKKAAPVMKIICDILSLVLKVRTQLTSSSWAWDASTAQVIHPCFRNIKKSYMAFKEYSGFLYKVVAKLVTRGYQPHLEEFMLRLNFNSYYQEHKS